AGPLVPRPSAAGLDWTAPDWPVPPHIHALATTRHGARGSVLDFGHRRGDAASSRRQLSQWLPNEPVWVAQAHGNIIIDADREEARATRCKGDGIVSRVIDRPCVVLTADCLPVLLTDRQATVVAAVHAGWRGLAPGVLEAAITALKASPARVLAWLGPAIGPEAFEVGRDVLEALCE